MRFAITAVDRCLGVLEALLAEGWRPVKLFTIPPHAITEVNKATIARAVELGIPIQLSRMDETDLRDLRDRGCEALICASYDWKIGDWRPYLPYAVNFHPSPLPEARGPYPAFQAILEDRRAWGVSCHKLEPRFDAGDILDAEPFELSAGECHESLSLKTEMALGRLAGRIARDLPGLWSRATPQGRGSYWKRLADEDRKLDFSQPVEMILRKARAFGLTESVAVLGDKIYYVRRAVGWTEAHGHEPGALVHSSGRRLLVAALDGYVGLIEWSLIPIATTEIVGRAIPPLWA